MFTGIVAGRRPVLQADRGDSGLQLLVDLGDLADGVALGDSIAIDGCCLTVDRRDGETVRFHAGRETLSLTALGGLAVGREVNVERALRFGDDLGGHLVSGHVDGVGRIVALEPEDSQTVLTIELPAALRDEVILKGSITVDGVSLTITDASRGRVSIALIPHTLEVTTLGSKSVGDPVNLETDLIGKWVLRQEQPVLAEIASIRARLDELEKGSD